MRFSVIRFFVISASFISMLFYATASVAQLEDKVDSVIHPYIGGGLYISIIQQFGVGLGAESGIKFGFFYVGIEGGYSRLQIAHGYEGAGFPGKAYPYDERVALVFYGIHAGVMPSSGNGVIGFGFVLLGGTQTFEHHEPNSDFSYTSTTFTRRLFVVGPDVRIYPGRHILLDLSFTYYAGLRFGFDYVM